ncbi:MAG: carboxypeptidase regulatory-like domain-containing protein [Bacillota bacterium]
MAIIKDKYNLVYSDEFTLQDKEEFEVTLSLTESENDSSAISGVVVDPEGNPEPNATVKLFDENAKPYLHVLTDETGAYVFEDLASGTYSIACTTSKCPISIPKTVILNPNEFQNVDFTLEYDSSMELGTVAGIVKELLDNDETLAAEGGKVYLKDAETDETIATTLSADDGEFVFYAIEDGEYNVVATKDGYKVSNPILISISGGNIVNSTLIIVKDPDKNTGTISGFVKYDGVAKTGVYVGLYEINATSKQIERCVATTRTNDIGYYMFGNVQKGNYVVKAKKNDR